jgi:GrpB-like predicted nucleotidyltransferase (UPF0157 family)
MPPNTHASDGNSGASTDAYLASVTIGARQPLNGMIHLMPHDPSWASKFTLLAEQVRDALGDAVLLLEHVGSTSVPGLLAKPIIDMVLAVRDVTDESLYVPALEARGFVLKVREPDWFEHRLLKPPDGGANLHVLSAGCIEIQRMIVLRDWLRTHEDDRQRYEAVKRDLASRTWKHVQNYAEAKSEVVREILARAGRSLGQDLVSTGEVTQ